MNIDYIDAGIPEPSLDYKEQHFLMNGTPEAVCETFIYKCSYTRQDMLKQLNSLEQTDWSIFKSCFPLIWSSDYSDKFPVKIQWMVWGTLFQPWNLLILTDILDHTTILTTY